MDHGGHACGNLSIPAEEVSLGSPRVGTVHVQAPTPHTPPLRAFLVDFSQQTTRFSHLLAMGSDETAIALPGGPRVIYFFDGKRGAIGAK